MSTERTTMQRIKEDINEIYCDEEVPPNQRRSRLQEIIDECETLRDDIAEDESDETEYEAELVD